MAEKLLLKMNKQMSGSSLLKLNFTESRLIQIEMEILTEGSQNVVVVKVKKSKKSYLEALNIKKKSVIAFGR